MDDLSLRIDALNLESSFRIPVEPKIEESIENSKLSFIHWKKGMMNYPKMSGDTMTKLIQFCIMWKDFIFTASRFYKFHRDVGILIGCEIFRDGVFKSIDNEGYKQTTTLVNEDVRIVFLWKYRVHMNKLCYKLINIQFISS